MVIYLGRRGARHPKGRGPIPNPFDPSPSRRSMAGQRYLYRLVVDISSRLLALAGQGQQVIEEVLRLGPNQDLGAAQAAADLLETVRAGRPLSQGLADLFDHALDVADREITHRDLEMLVEPLRRGIPSGDDGPAKKMTFKQIVTATIIFCRIDDHSTLLQQGEQLSVADVAQKDHVSAFPQVQGLHQVTIGPGKRMVHGTAVGR